MPENLVTLHSLQGGHEEMQKHVSDQNLNGYKLVTVLHFSGETYVFFWEKVAYN